MPISERALPMQYQNNDTPIEYAFIVSYPLKHSITHVGITHVNKIMHDAPFSHCSIDNKGFSDNYYRKSSKYYQPAAAIDGVDQLGLSNTFTDNNIIIFKLWFFQTAFFLQMLIR